MIYASPMSIEIVVAAMRVGGVGFVATRNQVDAESGYVMHTPELLALVRSLGRTEICRDHSWTDMAKIGRDIALGVKTIHLDPFEAGGTIEGAAKLTADAICQLSRLYAGVNFEVGTERRRGPYKAPELEQFLYLLHKDTAPFWENVRYGVVQGGTLVRDGKNEDDYDTEDFCKQIAVCRKYGLATKEHNCDFLDDYSIQKRIAHGLDSINIGPELIALQNEMILQRMPEDVLIYTQGFCAGMPEWKIWTGDASQAARLTLHYHYYREPLASVLPLYRESAAIVDRLVEVIQRKKTVATA